jgi:hypothetical protein
MAADIRICYKTAMYSADTDLLFPTQNGHLPNERVIACSGGF